MITASANEQNKCLRATIGNANTELRVSGVQTTLQIGGKVGFYQRTNCTPCHTTQNWQRTFSKTLSSILQLFSLILKMTRCLCGKQSASCSLTVSVVVNMSCSHPSAQRGVQRRAERGGRISALLVWPFFVSFLPHMALLIIQFHFPSVFSFPCTTCAITSHQCCCLSFIFIH